MNDELEMKIRERAHAMWEGESRPDGLAERHWLAAEREVTEEADGHAGARNRHGEEDGRRQEGMNAPAEGRL